MGNISSTSKKLELITIPNKNYAQVLINTSETKDFYLEQCHNNKANSIARRSLTYSANTISHNDNNNATTYINNIYSELPIRLLRELDIVHIVQLMPSADGGMPHTRADNIICYPNFNQLYSKTTLIHELWHIHQRLYADMWLKAFKQIGWTMWNGQLPDQLENARRYNPDTIDCPLWTFNNIWIPIPIFKDITHPNVAEVDIWFYNSKKHYHVTQVPLEISSYFLAIPQMAYEHPREIAAYMLSDPERYSKSLGFNKLLDSIGHISIMTPVQQKITLN